ncbi:MAG: hypothetical protein CL676_11405 [Bdellovibrionaceae bacterium]|nr:hypothetical protein [Pseudobdellovibrionaceae bacterium]|tara:strand:+ start:2538 stop:3914 length:1377 start_codon:yes stop_codon:yes gene_type:complete
MKSFAMKNLNLIHDALNASAIVAITDAKGQIKWVNEMFCHISGYSEKELIGKNHRILKSGEHSKEFYQEMWRTIAQGKTWEGEIKNRHKSGQPYWVKTYIFPYQDSETGEKEYVSIRWDITEKKEDEVNVNSLMDSAMEGLMVYNLNEEVIWANQWVRDIFQKPVIVGESVGDLFQGQYLPFSNNTQELRLNHDTGRVFETTTNPFFWKGKRSFLVTIRDVTERLNFEAQMIQQDRLSSVGLMAAGLAHEIGTPLGVVRGRAELALMDVENSEKVKNHLIEIESQIDRISNLIQSLLQISRGSNEAKTSEVCPFQVVEKVKSFLSFELEQKGIELKVEVDSKLKVHAEFNSLFQIFLNLVMNAIYAVLAKKSSDGNQIRIYSQIEEGALRFVVEDNGIGISKANQAKLFVPFFTSKEPGQGTGLGLVVSRKLMRSWGGELEILSEEGKGASAILSFYL